MKQILTPVLIVLFFISFAKANPPKSNFPKKERTNQPPVFDKIPTQIIEQGALFSNINLNTYLTEPDGDAVEWTYFFNNNLSNGETTDWDYSSSNLNMTLATKIKIRGEFTDASGDKLAAFHDGELIGSAAAQEVPKNSNNWFFFLTIYGNSDDLVNFKYFDLSQSSVFDVEDTIQYYSGLTMGLPVPEEMNAGYISALPDSINFNGILTPKVYNADWAGTDTIYVVAREVGTAENYADTARIIFRVNSNSLPLELISFSGKTLNEKSMLQWEIANPINVAGYEVQRGVSNSSGHLIWEYLDFILHSDSKLSYNFIDDLPFRNTNYYRLKIIDLDETYSWSPILSLHFEENEKAKIQLFPNPIFHSQQFFISIKTEEPAPVEVQIFDQMGRPFSELNLEAKGAHQYFPIQLGVMPAGFYIAKIKVRHQVFNRSFIIVDD